MVAPEMHLKRRDFVRLSMAVAAGGIAAAVLPQQSARAALPGTVGYRNNDLHPEVGFASYWGQTYLLALDYLCRSVVTDLGSSRHFTSVRLASDGVSTRLEKTDLSLYTSNDNVTYTRIVDWDFLKIGNELTLFNISATARYVKVRTHINDASYTFGNTLQQMMSVSDEPSGRWTYHGGSGWSWRKAITVSNSHGATVYDRAVYVTKAQLGIAALVGAGKVQPDLADIRFSTTTDRELQFYSDSDGFFVRIPQMAPNGSTTIYANYGNPSATYRGDGQEALQVEYGNKTLQSQKSGIFGSNIKPVILPDGTVMMVGQTDKTQGIMARYSFNGGRTWTTPEALIDPGSRAGVRLDSPGGVHVDPVTGQVTLIFYSYLRYNAEAGNALDPAFCSCDLYVARAVSYANQRPVFGAPAKVTGMVTDGGDPINYAVTYANIVKLTSGRLLAPFAHVYSPDGALAVSVLRSDDNGLTWTRSGNQIEAAGSGHEAGPSEAGLLQRNDGSLVMLMRQQHPDKYHFGVSTSTNQGITWSGIQDSKVLSSNTMPALSRHHNGDALLTWSGHNAMNCTSYIRNDVTVAYSSNDTASWNGYRDLLGRTNLSRPNWTANPSYRATEVDSVAPTSDTRLFAWSSTLSSLLVEDFDRYLYRSHGVLDDFEYENTALTPDEGNRMVNDYWWKSNPVGTVATDTSRKLRGTRSLRIQDNEFSTYYSASASRLFPAVRRARVRFSLNAASLSSELYIALQEGFCDEWNARGAAFILRVGTNGSLRYTSSSSFSTRSRVGYSSNDVAPTQQNLGFLGRKVNFALDYRRRSVGMDLGSTKTTTKIILTEWDETNRIAMSDLSIYTSPTNNGDWTLVSGWTGTTSGNTITLSGMSAVGRYIKVNTTYADDAYTFANNLQSIMAVETLEPDPAIPFTDFGNPVTLGLNQWHRIAVDLDLNSGSASVNVNGQLAGTMAQAHPAEAIGHFFVGGGAGTGTDVFLDELIIQDTSSGLPVVSAVGSETSHP